MFVKHYYNCKISYVYFRQKLLQAELNPSVAFSPPGTGLFIQSYSDRPNQFQTIDTTNNKTICEVNGKKNSYGAIATEGSIVVPLDTFCSKPFVDTALESIADDIAAKQSQGNVDGNGCTAVVSFKPFEGSIHSR